MSMFYDTTFTIRRLTQLDAHRSAYSATLTSYKGCLQSMQDDRVQMLNGKLGQMFDLYSDIACQMREGDTAVVSGVKYSVQGEGQFDRIGGTLNHKRYIVVKEEE